MKQTEWIRSILAGTSLEGPLTELCRIYDEAETAMSRFREASGIGCPAGCGICCEGFDPDVVPIEAELAAAWLVAVQPDRARHLAAEPWRETSVSVFPGPEAAPGSDASARVSMEPAAGATAPVDDGCMLFHADGPGHCTIYEPRPLICRLFGFSAVLDKGGRDTYRICSKMVGVSGSDGLPVRRFSGSMLSERFGATPPVMQDYARAVLALDPGASWIRRPLSEAIGPAVRKILGLIGYFRPAA